MQIIKEKYEIEETLNKRVRNILVFLNLKGKLEEGNVISIAKTNLAYIEPHKSRIKDITYLFFNDFDDGMLTRDLESIKYILDPLYHNKFLKKWKEMSIKEKQELIMNYIDSIEVIKTNDDVKIKNINFRNTFIKEYVKLFSDGGLTKHINVSSNKDTSEMEICYPMTREEAEQYVEKLSKHCPIEYIEVKKQKYENNQFRLDYINAEENTIPFKAIPILNKKGIKKVESFGVIGVPRPPIILEFEENIKSS